MHRFSHQSGRTHVISMNGEANFGSARLTCIMSDCIIPPKQTVTVTEYLPAIGDTYVGTVSLTAVSHGGGNSIPTRTAAVPAGTVFGSASISERTYSHNSDFTEDIGTGNITPGGTYGTLSWSGNTFTLTGRYPSSVDFITQSRSATIICYK